MKIIHYGDVPGKNIEADGVKGVTGRVLIGSADGADNFCMRVFEVEPGGFTPRHVHEWEHEIFVHSGRGEVYSGGVWNALLPGDAVFIPGNEEHQLRNSGSELFVFVCLIPSGPPEI